MALFHPKRPLTAKRLLKKVQKWSLAQAREAKRIKIVKAKEQQAGRLAVLNPKSGSTGSASFRKQNYNPSTAEFLATGGEPSFAVYNVTAPPKEELMPITFNLTRPSAPQATAPAISVAKAEAIRKAQEAKAARAQERKITQAKRLQQASMARAQRQANVTAIKVAESGEGAVVSSNVAQVIWSYEMTQIYILFHNGAWYRYDMSQKDRAREIFLQILAGNARCKTDDPTGMKRWWKTKTPSVGAAVWKYLRRRNVPYKRVNGPPTQFAGGSLMVESWQDTGVKQEPP